MQRFRIHLMIVVVVTVIALALTGALAQQQNPRQLFERARMLDESNQNLTEAIKLYGQVVKEAQEQRALAARAQLRVGLLYERLGRKAEALRAFQAVISQYADQTDVARQAQVKLPASLQAKSNSSATGNATSPTIRQVPGAALSNAVSPDGRYLSGWDPETGNLAIQDLSTDEKRRLTNKTSKDEWFDESVFSPDSKQIAYSWRITKDKKDFHELRIIGIDGSGSRNLYRLDESSFIGCLTWAPDGKHILVS